MSAPLIAIRNLRHSYGDGAGKKEVLHDINVDFHSGEIVIIMGPSGGGKTTLLSLAGALRSVQSGSIEVAGVQLRGASKRTLIEARRRVGFVFQAHNLVESLTIRENVQMALAVDRSATAASSRRQALDLLTRVGLAEHATKRPRQLSGGQKQRVAIARALVRSPQIIMADEPTAALDRHSGREVVELLKHLAHELRCAVLLVTHDNRILDVADRILTLEDGYIEESHLALDRLVSEQVELMDLLARYPAHLTSPGLLEMKTEFAGRLSPMVPRLAALVSRYQAGTMAQRSERWAETAENLRYLEESLGQIANAMSAVSGHADELRDAIAQSLDFLLRTAAHSMRSRSPQDAVTLANLTSNRAKAQEAIRARYENLNPNTSKEQTLELDLIQLYFRCVYFLNHIAERLKQDIDASVPAAANGALSPASIDHGA